jgi:hypothetical protein
MSPPSWLELQMDRSQGEMTIRVRRDTWRQRLGLAWFVARRLRPWFMRPVLFVLVLMEKPT